MSSFPIVMVVQVSLTVEGPVDIERRNLMILEPWE